MLTLQGPPLRLGLVSRAVGAHRLVLRVGRPRLVLRERLCQATTRELVRAVAVPFTAGFQVVREFHVHTSGGLPADLPRTAPAATALRPVNRPVTRTVAHESGRVERLHVQTVRERIRVEHASGRSRAGARAHQRSVATRMRAPVRLSPPVEVVPAAHQAQQPTATSAPVSPVAAADPSLAALPPVAPPRSPSVEEIAERVLRLIERRARAQRERLGSL